MPSGNSRRRADAVSVVLVVVAVVVVVVVHTPSGAQAGEEKSRHLKKAERILYQIATPTCNRQAWTAVRAIGVQVMHRDHSHSAGSGLARINRRLAAIVTYCNPLAHLGR